MKLNKYFMMAAMGLGLVACSDNLDESQGANGNASQEGTTYVALKLDFNNASSRATGDQPVDGTDGTIPPDYDDAEEGNEGDINVVRIIVTDADGNIEFNQSVDKSTVEKQDFYMIKIKPGSKKFYAIVNGEDVPGMPTTAGVKLTDPFLLTVTSDNLYEYSGTENDNTKKGFAMSSVEAVPATIYDNISVEAAQAGPQNKVSIEVERMVAKVTVQLADELVGADGFNNEGFSLTGLTCQLMNAENLKSASPSYTSAGTYLMAHNVNGVRTTPYSDYVNDLTGIEESSLAQGNAQNLYVSSEESKNPQLRFYCLENTHAAYYQGNTTYLKINATMIPNNLVKFGKEDENITVMTDTKPSSAETFYMVTSGNVGEDNSKVYCVLKSSLINNYDAIVGGTDSDVDDKLAAVITTLNTAGYTFTKEYANGVGVFRVPVNDIMENGQYVNNEPVFRNDWYDLTITGIELPGDPAGEDGNDEGFDPDEPFHQDTNVAVTIANRKWNLVTYGGVVLQ